MDMYNILASVISTRPLINIPNARKAAQKDHVYTAKESREIDVSIIYSHTNTLLFSFYPTFRDMMKVSISVILCSKEGINVEIPQLKCPNRLYTMAIRRALQVICYAISCTH